MSSTKKLVLDRSFGEKVRRLMQNGPRGGCAQRQQVDDCNDVSGPYGVTPDNFWGWVHSVAVEQGAA